MASSRPAPELLMPEEAAALLRTTLPALYADVERGILPGVVRIGRRIRFNARVLRKFLSLTTVPPPSHYPELASGPDEGL